jgi:type IV pilus assembly protein PilA
MIRLKNLKKREGFTLIELMIVVAIIGILAAIAIPNFLRFQLRSKAGEGKVNLAAIRTGEEGYFAEFGTYIQAATSPAIGAGVPGASKVPWVDAGLALPPDNFATIGWAPEGDVFYVYAVAAGPTGGLNGAAAGTPPNTYFTAEAQSDIDGDAAMNFWGYVKPDPAGNAVAGPLGSCVATGVYNPVTAQLNLMSVVGPCAANMGQSIF